MKLMLTPTSGVPSEVTTCPRMTQAWLYRVKEEQNRDIKNALYVQTDKSLKPNFCFFQFVTQLNVEIKHCTRLSKSHNWTTNLSVASQGDFYWEWGDNEIRKLNFAFALIKKRVYLFHYRTQESKIMGLPIARLAWVVCKTQVDFQADIRSPEYTLIRSDHQTLQPTVGNHANPSLIWLKWRLDHVVSHLPPQVLIISTGQLLAATSSLGHGYFLIHLGIKHCHKLETINTGMLAAALNMSLPEARSFTYTNWSLGTQFYVN